MFAQTVPDTVGGIVQGIGVLFLFQGALFAFFGYHYHRTLVFMIGFVIGAIIGLILIPPNSMEMLAIVGVFSGAIGGYLVLVLEVALVGGIGVLMGDIIGMAMFHAGPFDAGPLLLAGVMGVLVWKGYVFVIILYTAAVGGLLFSYGYYVFEHSEQIGYYLAFNPAEIIEIFFSFGLLAGGVALLGVVVQSIFVFGMGASVGRSKPTVDCPNCGGDVNPLDDVCPHCRAQVGEEVTEQYLYSSRLSDTANLLAYETHTPHYESSGQSERTKTRSRTDNETEEVSERRSARQSDIVSCPGCGLSNQSDRDFCFNCGSSIG